MQDVLGQEPRNGEDMNRFYRRFLYKLPWLQSEWSPAGYVGMWVYLANLNGVRRIEPMEKV
jgi:hypothetical protein